MPKRIGYVLCLLCSSLEAEGEDKGEEEEEEEQEEQEDPWSSIFFMVHFIALSLEHRSWLMKFGSRGTPPKCYDG